MSVGHHALGVAEETGVLIVFSAAGHILDLVGGGGVSGLAEKGERGGRHKPAPHGNEEGMGGAGVPHEGAALGKEYHH